MTKLRYVVQVQDSTNKEWYITGNIDQPFFTNRKTAQAGIERARKRNTFDNLKYRVYDRLRRKAL